MSDGKIKGITVEIGGDLNPLEKAVKNTNQTINGMQRELKGVETLLQMDPSNVDLLRQKEELLTKSITETKTKLDALKKAKEQADKDMAAGTEVNQEEYRKLVREIVSTEQKLGKLTSSMKTFGSVGAQQVANVGKEMQDVGEKMQSFGTKTATAATAVVGAVFSAAEGTRELRGDLARLEVNAEQAGKTLDGMSSYMTQIVGVTGEVDSSVEGLSNLLATGLSEEGFARTMDALSGAAIKFSDTLKFEGIADGLQETLATGAAAGPFAELLERSGLVLDDFNAGLTTAIANGEQENYILQVLASTGLADFYNAYREGNPDLVEAAEAQYRLQEELAKLGTLIEPLLTSITTVAASLLAAFNSLSPGAQQVILMITGIAAVIGLLIPILGSLITHFGTILTVAPKLASGLGLVKTAVAAIGGPVTIVMAVIAALILKFIHAYNTSEEFRNKVNAAFQSVRETVSAVIVAVSAKVKEFISIGQNVVKGLWQGVSNMKNWLVSKMTGFVSGIKAVFTGKKGFDTHSPSKWAEEVMENVDKGFAKIDPKTSEAVQKAKEYSKAIMDAATSYLDTKKFFGEVTAQEEIAYWNDIAKSQNLAADELLEIDKKIYTAKQSILEEEKRAMEEYEASVKNRADAIAGFAGIFDAVAEETKVEGSTLLENLTEQVELLEQWQKDMQTLVDRGVTGAMLEELREQGPKAAAEIHSLTKMTDAELSEFGELYAQKIKLATETAVNELGGLQLAITPVVTDMAENAAYAVETTPISRQEEEKERQELYETIATMFATALLEGLNYVGNSIFDAIPKVLEFYIDSTKMAKTTWDAFDAEGERRNRMFAPTHSEIYKIALSAAKCRCGDKD